MKITDIKIDGFGVWRDLSLRGISPEVTVFYGPNEAGKSTLMQFLRSVLYGVSPSRRERYLPPLKGGRPGGWLKVIGDHGPLTISRYADRGPTDLGKVTVTTAEGEEQGDRLLREALEHVDEPTFINIFAVGLREVQELATLSDTAAAQWLYRLTSGLDRISLYDVIHMLAGTRQRLLNSAEHPSEIRALTARREQLHGELDELVAKGRRWTQAAVKLRDLADEVDQRQAAAKELTGRARRLETAINVKPLWLKRDKIDNQLEQYQNLRPLEEGTLTTLDDLNERTEEHQRQRDILIGQRQQLRDEAKRLGINDVLVKNGHRLEALLEQQEWLQSLERKARDRGDELAHLEARLASDNERLSHEWTGAGKLPPRISTELVDQLAPQARAIEATEQLLESAKQELEHRRAGEHEFRTQIDTAMTSGEKLGLPKDVDAAGDLVAALRTRHQLEHRLDAARRQADDLQRQGTEMVDGQVLPVGLFVWLLGIVALGGLAVGVWLLLPPSVLGSYGKYAGWFAGIGVIGALLAFFFKWVVEDSASDRFDACHRQLETVLQQIKQAEVERKQLDREMPMAEGAAALRLEHAERHLAELQRVLPIESQHREAAEESTAAERRLQLAEEKHAAALANWRAKLRAVGLPEDVSPANLHTMADQCERLAELESRIAARREDIERHQREYTAVSQRIFALADETGLRIAAAGPPATTKEVARSALSGDEKPKQKPTGNGGPASRLSPRPIEQLDKLAAEYREQTHRVAQRQELRERAKAIKIEALRHARAAKALAQRRGTLFQKCGVVDENELRQLAARLDEADALRKKRSGVTREIVAALGKHGTEQDFARLLAPESIGRLEHDWESLAAESEKLDRELKERLQQRGALLEQQRTQAADRSLARKQLELDMVEEQIKQAVHAWRERAGVSMFLERIRHDYEQHRQPETLKEASEYLRQLTSGKYTRIWTPLAHDILFVDTAEGESLPVQVLSRGTREQLFVSLRLALVAAFARRGIHLPMILDDVFVNFDAGRTTIAAAVLRDFARQGHQLIVFTCHEHVWRMFQDVHVDARRLPNRFGETSDEPAAEIFEPVVEPVVAPVLEEIEDQPPPEPPKPVVVDIKQPEALPAPPVAIAKEPPPAVEKKRPRPVVAKRRRSKPLEVEIEQVLPQEQAEIIQYAVPVGSPRPPQVEVEYWWPAAAASEK